MAAQDDFRHAGVEVLGFGMSQYFTKLNKDLTLYKNEELCAGPDLSLNGRTLRASDLGDTSTSRVMTLSEACE